MNWCDVSGINPRNPYLNSALRKAKVHIIDGFAHADNMEHFAKAALKKTDLVSDLTMHYVECNSLDINAKQINSIEDKLKSKSYLIKKGDYLILPGLASVSLLNLIDRIKKVLGVNINLTPENLKLNKNIIMEFLKTIYNNKAGYSSEISHLDKNSQGFAYTYGVINEINKLVDKGVNVYIPAGHGADSSIKWLAKSNNINNDLYYYISKNFDPDSKIKNLIKMANERKFYNFNLLSLCKGHIVNVKGRDNNDYIFSAKDSFINDGTRGVYNFTPIRNSQGKMLGYSYHDESTVEYPFEKYPGNSHIKNLCKYVGLQYSDFAPNDQEIKKFREYVSKGYSTDCLPDKLYPIHLVYRDEYIKIKNLDKLGCFINNKQDLVFDISSSGKILFHKTNCEGSEKPSVVSMWGSCFSSINAMVRDLKRKNGEEGYKRYYYIQKAQQNFKDRNYKEAEHYFNKALEILHPDKSSLHYYKDAIEIYEKLYETLKCQRKYKEAKGVSNIIINLKSNEIKNKSINDLTYRLEQSKIGNYYFELSLLCNKDGEFYPAKVCQWAANELKRGSYYGNKIVQRRAEQIQYIGDLYDACH